MFSFSLSLAPSPLSERPPLRDVSSFPVIVIASGCSFVILCRAVSSSLHLSSFLSSSSVILSSWVSESSLCHHYGLSAFSFSHWLTDRSRHVRDDLGHSPLDSAQHRGWTSCGRGLSPSPGELCNTALPSVGVRLFFPREQGTFPRHSVQVQAQSHSSCPEARGQRAPNASSSPSDSLHGLVPYLYRTLLQQLQKLQTLVMGKVSRTCKLAGTQTGTCLMVSFLKGQQHDCPRPLPSL